MTNMTVDTTTNPSGVDELLSEQDRFLLSDLLEGSSLRCGLDAKAFRAKHFQVFSAVERLEALGFIQRDGDRYFIDVTMLPRLKTRTSEAILENCEKIFVLLKAHYFHTQTTPIPITTIARRAKLPRNTTLIAMFYMIHTQCIGGRTTDIFGDPKAYVYPAEVVLKFDSFAAALVQLSGWHQKHLRASQIMSSQGALNLQHRDVAKIPDSVEDRSSHPSWVTQLPPGLQDLLIEVYRAKASGLRALSAMGIRAVIDIICVEVVGDVGSFQKKIAAMLAGNHISEADHHHVLAAIEMGNASAHRGHIPTKEDLDMLLLICERLVSGKYVIPKGAEVLRGNTPARQAHILPQPRL